MLIVFFQQDTSSVFRRLGGKTTVKRAATSTSQDLLDVDDDTGCQNDPPLQYEGVLKTSPKKAKTAVQTEITKFKVTLKNPLQDRLGMYQDFMYVYVWCFL